MHRTASTRENAAEFRRACCMPATAHVLVVLDPHAKRQPALERAAWLAQRTGATLELFVCDYDPDLATSALLDDAALECARRRLLATHVRTLKEHAKRLAAQGILAKVDAQWHHPCDEGVIRKAADIDAALVLKGTHFHAELQRAVFTNTDWNLIRACPAPLWLVKPRSFGSPPTILAAVDPLPRLGRIRLEDRILATAAELRSALGGALKVFHAYDVAPALAASADLLAAPMSAPIHELSRSLQQAHDEAVFALTDRHALERCCVEVREGPPRALLPAISAQMNADVIVLGALSRSGHPRAFVGSTAEHVLDKLPCDVLIVKPAEMAALCSC
jgi:universal stress protein E